MKKDLAKLVENKNLTQGHFKTFKISALYITGILRTSSLGKREGSLLGEMEGWSLGLGDIDGLSDGVWEGKAVL